MKLHYAGKFNGDEMSLPQREHPKNAVMFKEPNSMKTLAIVANVIAFVIAIVFAVILFLIFDDYLERTNTSVVDVNFITIFGASILGMLIMIPHEILHAICFKEDVFLYTNLGKLMLFVIGNEDMSKSRFIFMSLLPNIMFGFLPFIFFAFNPQYLGTGFFGMICISSGAGDYINVFNAITQVPNNAKVYMSGMHSYWYIKNN